MANNTQPEHIKKSITNAFIPRMDEIKDKSEEYFNTHNEEPISWCGKYAKGSLSDTICPTQQIYINGLSNSEIKELRVNGLMPYEEYFNMWVKQ